MAPSRTSFALLASAAVVFVGYVTIGAHVEPARAQGPLSDLEAEERSSPSYLVTPFEQPISPEAALERRLAALAASIEARQLRGAAAGLVRFDVEGLNDALYEAVSRVVEHADVSVHVRDLETQHVLFDYYGDAPLNPASNQKLLTTSAAIDLLGADYVFESTVALFETDLFLIGEGDPTLGVDDLQELAAEVVAGEHLMGVRRIVVDDSAFSPRRFGPGYSPTGPGYAHEAPSGALSLDFNTIEVTVYPMRGGRTVGVSVEPPSAHTVVRSRARTGRRTRLDVRTRARGEQTLVEVSGVVARAGRPVVERRRVVDPGRFAGEVFARILADRSETEVLPVARGKAPDDAEVLAQHASDPLIEVVDDGLAYSNNFYAEQILRTLAWRITGDPGDWQHGEDILRGYWLALGNDPEGLVFENASGLSDIGRVTTSGLVDLISVAHRSQREGTGLIAALPVAGEPGTLRTRLRISGKRVRAKTGTLAGVSGLSGVITAEDGTPEIAFSILINVRESSALNASARRRVEDEIVLQVLSYLDQYHARLGGITGKGRRSRRRP
jgi:D-alanyl-D-alanine carboxypeptidase/D-alanyl-D-alanine-endopeptidase (penicillin-binding protein 4)